MRSESEIRWVRVKNRVGNLLKTSQWHAIVPGQGSTNVPPGVSCDTILTGTYQFAGHVEVKTLDGKRHEACEEFAHQWVLGLNPSPGPREPDDEWTTFAAPGSQSK